MRKSTTGILPTETSKSRKSTRGQVYIDYKQLARVTTNKQKIKVKTREDERDAAGNGQSNNNNHRVLHQLHRIFNSRNVEKRCFNSNYREEGGKQEGQTK